MYSDRQEKKRRWLLPLLVILAVALAVSAFAARQSRTYWFRLVPFASAHSLTSCTIAGGIDNVMLIFASYTAFAALSSHVFY